MKASAGFVGTGVAIATPFANYSVDFEALERLVEHVIDGGVDYLVALGSTGESALLSIDERRKVLDFVIEKVDRRVPIVAGNFGGNNTTALCRKIEQYNFEGIDAVLSSSPHYVKPTQEGIYQHYKAIHEACPVPIIIYNVPGRTASKIAPETVLRLARDFNNIIGVKDATTNMVDASAIHRGRPDGFLLLSGDDPTALQLILSGGDGVISVIANAFPKIFSDMVRAALNGDNEVARSLHERLLHIHPLLYAEGNPVGIKGALELLNICWREVRKPLLPLSGTTMIKLKNAVEGLEKL